MAELGSNNGAENGGNGRSGVATMHIPGNPGSRITDRAHLNSNRAVVEPDG